MSHAADRSDLEARTRYDPSEVEPRIARVWLDSGLFAPEPGGDPADNYSIAIPLPNVTGVLHMGHALNNSIQDCLIRFNRMRSPSGPKWILGTDHAGIATQTQVERAVIAEGTSREELGREAFVERVWRWRDEYGGQIIEQLKRLGASLDYDDERFTLDDRYARAVQHVFVALYEKGYIYRDRYMVNWDPGTGSAISDLEVEDREVEDTLYYIDYPLASGSGAVTVATVRPETMLADTAIAVHPDDERYRRLVGEKAILPLVGRKLKIIADELRQTRLRHRRAQDHPGPRSQRLRDRPAPRPSADQRDRRGRAHHRRGARAVRRHDGRGGPAGGCRRAARRGAGRADRGLRPRGARTRSARASGSSR